MTEVDESNTHHNQECTSSSTVGTVDVWKNYLAIGFPNITVVDLDTKERKDLQIYCSLEVHC